MGWGIQAEIPHRATLHFGGDSNLKEKHLSQS
jgi:hypothetical protein